MKRILAGILCICLLAGLFSGCAMEEEPYVPTGDGLTWDEGEGPGTEEEEEVPEQDLVMMFYPNITLNPYLCNDFTNRTLFSLLYQSLFVVDSAYNVFPMLCKSYTMTDDMRTYTFYIEEATFSDGTPLTIEDVLASYTAAKESNIYKGRFNHVTKISLTEDGGICFKTDTAFESLPQILDVPIVKAAEVAVDRPLGTGPYYMDQTTSGTRLRRRTDWWCQAEMVLTTTSIPLRMAESVTQIRDSFEFSDVGLVCADPNVENYADYRSDYELWDSENGGFLYIGCNTQSELFSNTKLRAALTYIINRDEIVEKYYNDFAHAATLPASPLSPYYSNTLAKRYEYDPDKFIQALNEAGKVGATLKLLVNRKDTLRLRVARYLAAELKACGLNVELVERSAEYYRYVLEMGEYDIYLGQTRLSSTMDLSSFFAPRGALRYGMSDPAFYSLCKDALANRGNYFNLHQSIMQDGRLCPVLFQSYSVHATRGLLTGLTPSRDNVFFYTIGKTMVDVFVYE